jgi:hypothetical protein
MDASELRDLQLPALAYAPDEKIKPNAAAYQDKAGNLFFISYQTVIAFIPAAGTYAGELIQLKNYWGTTTGKHLGWIQRRYERGAVLARQDKETFRALFLKHIGY